MGINILILLSLCSLMFHTSSAAKLKDITAVSSVMEICQLTENPKLCESSIGNSVVGKTTAEAVLQKQIEVTLTEVDRAEKEATELAAKDPKDDKRNACFQECSGEFEKAEVQLNDALKALGTKDITTLEALLSDVIDHFEACDDAFDDIGLEPSLEETTHQLQRLTTNCQFLARALE